MRCPIGFLDLFNPNKRLLPSGICAGNNATRKTGDTGSNYRKEKRV